ncbi:DUF4402 domain-containing protein [Salinimicrobium tongyeongense]|jgi:hypothetical protein|uniref:DUF4402 domain-containing protein n=1 Tax=Salinimicrobium tongyeongense TaxID=2809707 RepID=A0ABY6NRI0_9FLAO|nr:DUF4402 domain-containing protein [Salinimicrobium tongyeongense]UZH55156.1 DUF4402 domain-containing protein [Salinimicrobium tongyeongense]
MSGKSLFLFISFSLLLIPFSKVAAQENPPIPVTVEVRNAQGLNFGAFIVGNAGGNVILTPNGDRSGDTSVHLLNLGSTPHYAIFDIYANPGTLLQIQPVSDIILDGPSGSRVTLSIDPFFDISTGQTFITTSNPHEVFVGGKLYIPSGDAGPAGNYNGTFSLTFIHE